MNGATGCTRLSLLALAAGALIVAFVGCSGPEDVPDRWEEFRKLHPLRVICYVYEHHLGPEAEEWSSSLTIEAELGGEKSPKRIEASLERRTGIPGGPTPIKRKWGLAPAERQELLDLLAAVDLKLGEPVVEAEKSREKDKKKRPESVRDDFARKVRITLSYKVVELEKGESIEKTERVTGRPVNEKDWSAFAKRLEAVARKTPAAEE
jgi:hypothetical protein